MIMGRPFRTAFLSLSLLVGTIALAGWIFDVAALKSVLPGWITMKANTAVAILSAGLGLALLPAEPPMDAAPWRRVLAAGSGAVALLLGASVLLEYAAGFSLGIDQVLFHDLDTASLPYPGRMAPATAFALACAGLSVLLVSQVASDREDGRRSLLAAMAAHLLAGILAAAGYLAVTAYVYDVEGLHSFGAFATVALNTASVFLLLSLSILLTYPDLGWRRGFLARPIAWRVFLRLLPVALLVPFVAGAVVVWGARRHLYDPLYGPVLFALVSALTALALTRDSVNAVCRAEGRMDDLSAALRESEAGFRAITDAVPQMVWSTRPDGYHDFFNERWYLMTGTTPDQMTGEGRKAQLHPEDRTRAWTGWQHSLATGEPYEMEYRLRMADGAYRWFLGRALPLLDAGGTVTRWFGTCTDIEQTVAARDALARSRVELERLVVARTQDLQETQTRLAHVQRMEALGQLAGGIAHDFNNVLQAVQSAAALLERRTGDPDGVRRLSRMIFEAAGRGNAITRRLLAFSRRGDLRAEPLDPMPVLADIRDILSHTLGATIEVHTAAAAGLPRMLADQSQLETVMVNLATNARDAMPRGRPAEPSWRPRREHHSRRQARRSHPVALIGRVPTCASSISDTGTRHGRGHARPAPASHSSPPNRPAQGTGLGLAMARGFAEQSGGGLHIESAPGRGTDGDALVPGDRRSARHHRPANACAARASHRSGGKRPGPAVARRRRSHGARRSSRRRWRRRATPSRQPRRARPRLALLDAGERVDLLVSDLSMPGMDGLTLIRQCPVPPGRGSPPSCSPATRRRRRRSRSASAVRGSLALLRKPIRGKSTRPTRSPPCSTLGRRSTAVR